MGLPAMTLSPNTTGADMLLLDHQQHHSQIPPAMQLLGGSSLASKVLTGVYTVSEEPELEAAETNSAM